LFVFCDIWWWCVFFVVVCPQRYVTVHWKLLAFTCSISWNTCEYHREKNFLVLKLCALKNYIKKCPSLSCTMGSCQPCYPWAQLLTVNV
jgi:hypothetical protein